MKVGEGPVHVLSATADQMFLNITPSEAEGLPRYTGEMELTNHSAGSLTSEAYQKRWIRKEELLADAAETSRHLMIFHVATEISILLLPLLVARVVERHRGRKRAVEPTVVSVPTEAGA